MSLAQISSTSSVTFATSATRFFPLGVGADLNSATEAHNALPCRTAGTYSDFSLYQQTSLASGATATFRKNTADGNQTISIGSGVTGALQDLSNTDTVVAGDLIAIQYVNATAANARVTGMGCVFEDSSSDRVYRLAARRDSFSSATASTTSFFPVGGVIPNAAATTEANAQYKNRLTATIRNAAIYVSANARSTTTTFRSRVNGANGNISISIGASTTGLLEDTSNSDSIVNTDLICTSLTTGTGAGTITVRGTLLEYVTSSASAPILCGSANGTSAASAETRYNSISGGISNNSTEVNISAPLWTSGTLSNLQCYVSVNTIAATSTLTSRIAGADGNLTLSIGSTATGYFEDTTNSDTVTATNRLATKLVVGTSATNALTIHNIGCNILYDYPSNGAGLLNFWLGSTF
jgi:hypothetical protein